MRVKLDKLQELAAEIVEKYSEYRIFVLQGEMGAGKTTFSKSFCNLLGAKEDVNSPTFSIANIYTSNKFGEIYHFDFYRLESTREAIDIGIDDYLYSGNYCIIEWADIIIDYIPKPYVEIKILHCDSIDERDFIVNVID